MPLLAVNSLGQVYEVDSKTNDGRGMGKAPTFSDQGTLYLGESDATEISNREVYRKRQAIQNKVKKVIAAKKRRYKEALDAKRNEEQYNQERNEKIRKHKSEKRKAHLRAIAKGYKNSGHEYSSLHGDDDNGFSAMGETLKNDFTYDGNDIQESEAYGRNTMLDGETYDEGFGRRFRVRPRAIVRAVARPVAKAAVSPVKIVTKIAPKIPVVSTVYKTTDKYSGGLLTSANTIANLPVKAASGEKISKAELMTTLSTAVKVGAVVASGGTAASFVGAGAGAMKQGPLGKTSLGRNLLTVGAVAGGDLITGAGAGAGQIITDTAITVAADKAQAKATNEAMKKMEKVTGIKMGIVGDAINVATSGDPQEAAQNIAKQRAIDEGFKRAGLSNYQTQIMLGANAAQAGVDIDTMPDLTMTAIQRKIETEKVKLEENFNIENIRQKGINNVKKNVDIKNLILKNLERLKFAKSQQEKDEINKEIADEGNELKAVQVEIGKNDTELKLATLQANVKIAASEEGRYKSGRSIIHPILAVNQKIESNVPKATPKQIAEAKATVAATTIKKETETKNVKNLNQVQNGHLG